MRITILPKAIILTKAHRDADSQGVLPLKCFLFLLPNFIHVYAIVMQFHILTKEKYCNRNTPIPQYFYFLTSGWCKFDFSMCWPEAIGAIHLSGPFLESFTLLCIRRGI